MSHVDPMPDAGELPPQGNSNGKANGNGVLATLDAASASVPALSWAHQPPARPEILSAKPNPAELLHAVRRRWTLAIGLGTTAAVLAMALVWYLVPVRYEVFSLLRVAGQEDKVLKTGGPSAGFEIFKRTQEQYIRSGLVLETATLEPKVSRLPTMQQHNDDAVGYLRGQLIIDYPNDAEILRVAMIGRRPDDLTVIVNTVVDKYIKEVVERERDERQRHQEKLNAYLQELNAKISSISDQLFKLQKDEKVSGTEVAQVERNNAMALYEDARERRREIHKHLNETYLQLNYLEKQKENSAGEVVPVQWLEAQLRYDPHLAKLSAEMVDLRGLLTRWQKALKDPNSPKIHNLENEITNHQEMFDERKAELTRVLADSYTGGAGNSGSNSLLSNLSKPELDFAKDYYEAQILIADDDFRSATKELMNVDRRSGMVQNREEELQRLRKVRSDLAMEVDLTNLERFAAPRINRLDAAILANPNGDAVRKYIGIVFSGLLSFATVVLAIGFVEFQSRRVNTPHEVSDGLGIRVVGQLPRISSHTWQRARGGSAMLKALMSERIDGTRTALIHTTDIHPPRVVMITSAEPREGKTTTASQLAASLARSGRRTLLVDADVRNPGMHRVFELAPEPGLCELLRGEAEREAVIQPTRTANLWLLPAGRCDARSLQALSRSYLGSAIAALAVQFDYVIIDAPPVLKVADPLMIGQHVDAAIVSVLRDVSQVPKVYEATERLRSVGITVLGSVVNGVNDDAARSGVELMMAETT